MEWKSVNTKFVKYYVCRIISDRLQIIIQTIDNGVSLLIKHQNKNDYPAHLLMILCVPFLVQFYHEVSQLFKKESRDFCILQAERTEGVKCIITLQSVDWPPCAETPNVVRAKVSVKLVLNPFELKMLLVVIFPLLGIGEGRPNLRGFACWSFCRAAGSLNRF